MFVLGGLLLASAEMILVLLSMVLSVRHIPVPRAG